MKKCFLLFSLFASVTCFAQTYKFIPVKMEAQNEYLREGRTSMVSGKINQVILSQTEGVINNGKASFQLSCLNQESCPINLYFQNVSVTDQWGRPIRIIRKEELISKKKSEKKWSKFFSALCTGIECSNAQNAGDITLHSRTTDVYHNSMNGMRSQGNSCSTTTETIRCEAIRQQALRDVQIQGQMRDAMIEEDYQGYKSAMKHGYFDSNTIFPQTAYDSFFQIAIPKGIEKQLEYVFVNVDFGQERHTFCFYCAQRRR